MRDALYINGVFDSVLKEIVKVQSGCFRSTAVLAAVCECVCFNSRNSIGQPIEFLRLQDAAASETSFSMDWSATCSILARCAVG